MEQQKWVGLFYFKDRDSFESCLKENDAVGANRDAIKKTLGNTKHSVLILNTDQPTSYALIVP